MYSEVDGTLLGSSSDQSSIIFENPKKFIKAPM